nr:MAG TPA: hypothetical protein [Caudoviricetes sp.]
MLLHYAHNITRQSPPRLSHKVKRITLRNSGR